MTLSSCSSSMDLPKSQLFPDILCKQEKERDKLFQDFLCTEAAPMEKQNADGDMEVQGGRDEDIVITLL